MSLAGIANSLRLVASSSRSAVVAVLARGMASSRAKRGLYGGRDVRFGNNVSHSERRCVDAAVVVLGLLSVLCRVLLIVFLLVVLVLRGLQNPKEVEPECD